MTELWYDIAAREWQVGDGRGRCVVTLPGHLHRVEAEELGLALEDREADGETILGLEGQVEDLEADVAKITDVSEERLEECRRLEAEVARLEEALSKAGNILEGLAVEGARVTDEGCADDEAIANLGRWALEWLEAY